MWGGAIVQAREFARRFRHLPARAKRGPSFALPAATGSIALMQAIVRPDIIALPSTMIAATLVRRTACVRVLAVPV